MTRMEAALHSSFDGGPFEPIYALFEGECSQTQIDRLADLGQERRCTAVIGIGDGKILDTAKAVAYELHIPSVIIPTVASTDSPCSSLSVIYHEDGTFDRYLLLDACPDMVLVDTEVIAKAPASLLAAGMGDAMSTRFEARACHASGSPNQVGGTAHPRRPRTGGAVLDAFADLWPPGHEGHGDPHLLRGGGDHRGGEHLPFRCGL